MLADGEVDGDGLTLSDSLALGEILALGETEALSLALGLSELDGETEGDSELLGLRLALGETLGDSLLLGEREADGETLGDCELLGETLAEGDADALGDSEGDPANALRISIIPTAVGEALDKVKLAEGVEPIALNGWSQQVIPSPSMRSVQVAGEVKLGVASATQVTFIHERVAVRVSASHVEVVEEAF